MPQPPKIALQFLRWFCKEDCVEEIEGDLVEVFQKEYARNARKAKLKFAWSVMKYLRPRFVKAFRNSYQPNPVGMYWVFVSAAIGTLLITLLTVSYQSIKAALTNPVKSLKSE